MTAYEAREIIKQIKSQFRDSKIRRALDKALQVLAWKALEEKRSLFDDDEDIPSGEEF